MCGLVGAISRTEKPIDAATRTLRHRGPDARSTHVVKHRDHVASLGHARLSIIDLSERGAQPMVAGDLSIIFNGEIYNYEDIRKELVGLGHAMLSHSDTEVILAGYKQWGRDVLERLRGMFAFAIWDNRGDGELFVARDRLGQKPLYYAKLPDGGIAFASEIKALFALGVPRVARHGAIDEFLTYLYVPGPRTAFEGVLELLPAHSLTWDRRGTRIERYWSLPPIDARHESTADRAARLRDVLEEAVRLHMVSDVPVGAFLSGGLDSSSIVALMAKQTSRPVSTFTMTFGGEGEELYDERQYASEVASYFGTDHHEIPVRPSLVELLPEVVDHFDQPFGNPTALLTYELSRVTRSHVKVALAGDGGDESFLGYPRYAGVKLAELYRKTPKSLRRFVADHISNIVPESTRGRHELRRAREFLSTATMPSEQMYGEWVACFDEGMRSRLLTEDARATEPAEEYLERLLLEANASLEVDRAARADLRSFLPNNLLTYSDRMSMAHGLELRVPFCDHVLVEELAKIPASSRMRGLELKWLMKKSVAHILPRRILERPKLGFNPPMGIWLNRDLGALLDERLAPERLRKRGVLREDAVREIIDMHRSGKRDRSLHIWALLVVDAWLDTFERKSDSTSSSACPPASSAG